MKLFAFDCFGTVFDMSNISNEEIKAYVKHVNKADFTPFNFPDSWYNLKAHPDSAEGIKKLRETGHMCVTLSNGSVSLLKKISEANGIEWDRYIDLERSQIYKPHLKAYGLPEKLYNIKPKDSYMVTANPTFGDVKGAFKVGMCPVVIRQGYFPKDILEISQIFQQNS